MNQREAFRQTVALAQKMRLRPDGPLGLGHLNDMLKRIEADQNMSDAKLGRWLGWAQAAIAAHMKTGQGQWKTLDQMKAMNKKLSDKPDEKILKLAPWQNKFLRELCAARGMSTSEYRKLRRFIWVLMADSFEEGAIFVREAKRGQ